MTQSRDFFKIAPYKHQLDTLDVLRSHEYYAIFHQQGLGKTGLLIADILAAAETGAVNGAVVITLPGVHLNWLTELKKFWIKDIKPAKAFAWQPVYAGSDTYKRKFASFLADTGFKVLLLPISIFSTDSGIDLTRSFFKACASKVFLVVDESSTCKHGSSSRTKNVLKIAPYFKRRRIATGTPVTQGVFDLFYQAEILARKGSLLGFSNIMSFKRYYGVFQTIFYGPRSFPKLMGYQNLDILKQKIAAFGDIKTKEECLDLPPKIFCSFEVELDPKQRVFYNDLAKTYMAWLDSGESVDATNALLRLNRLFQCVYGYTKEDITNNIVDLSMQRIEAVQTCLETIGDKQVIIYCTDRWLQVKLHDALSEEHGHGNVVTYVGDTPASEREENKEKFISGKTKLLICSSAMAYGHTLVNCDTMIFASKSFNLEHRLQMEDRIHRIGQTRPVTYIDIIAQKSVEELQLEALRGKIEVGNEVIPMIRTWLNYQL